MAGMATSVHPKNVAWDTCPGCLSYPICLTFGASTMVKLNPLQEWRLEEDIKSLSSSWRASRLKTTTAHLPAWRRVLVSEELQTGEVVSCGREMVEHLACLQNAWNRVGIVSFLNDISKNGSNFSFWYVLDIFLPPAPRMISSSIAWTESSHLPFSLCICRKH